MIDETEVSVMEVANIISKKFGFSNEDLIFDDTKPKGQFRKPAASDIKDFNFKPIEDGINKTIDWFISNYETARK